MNRVKIFTPAFALEKEGRLIYNQNVRLCYILSLYKGEFPMKKMISILLLLAMVLSLCACGEKTPAQQPAQESPEATAQAAPAEALAP